MEGRCAPLALDSYYLPQPHLSLEERAARNYDHPDALDWSLIESHLDALALGQPVEVPAYMFDLHTRAPETRNFTPAEVVIVEGILALHHEGIRARAAVKVFVDTDERECLRRRMERDVSERGRSPESVRAQYAATVRPMTIEYVVPSRAHADVIVSGQESLARAVDQILRLLASRISPDARRDFP